MGKLRTRKFNRRAAVAITARPVERAALLNGADVRRIEGKIRYACRKKFRGVAVDQWAERIELFERKFDRGRRVERLFEDQLKTDERFSPQEKSRLITQSKKQFAALTQLHTFLKGRKGLKALRANIKDQLALDITQPIASWLLRFLRAAIADLHFKGQPQSLVLITGASIGTRRAFLKTTVDMDLPVPLRKYLGRKDLKSSRRVLIGNQLGRLLSSNRSVFSPSNRSDLFVIYNHDGLEVEGGLTFFEERVMIGKHDPEQNQDCREKNTVITSVIRNHVVGAKPREDLRFTNLPSVHFHLMHPRNGAIQGCRLIVHFMPSATPEPLSEIAAVEISDFDCIGRLMGKNRSFGLVFERLLERCLHRDFSFPTSARSGQIDPILTESLAVDPNIHQTGIMKAEVAGAMQKSGQQNVAVAVDRPQSIATLLGDIESELKAGENLEPQLISLNEAIRRMEQMIAVCHAPVRLQVVRFLKTVNSLPMASRHFGGLEENQQFTSALQRILTLIGERLLCPRCGEEGTLRCRPGTTRYGSFEFIHTRSSNRSSHGGWARLPDLKLSDRS